VLPPPEPPPATRTTSTVVVHAVVVRVPVDENTETLVLPILPTGLLGPIIPPLAIELYYLLID
jgi:hypothetical protein